jgi:hypothetical protein
MSLQQLDEVKDVVLDVAGRMSARLGHVVTQESHGESRQFD